MLGDYGLLLEEDYGIIFGRPELQWEDYTMCQNDAYAVYNTESQACEDRIDEEALEHCKAEVYPCSHNPACQYYCERELTESCDRIVEEQLTARIEFCSRQIAHDGTVPLAKLVAEGIVPTAKTIADEIVPRAEAQVKRLQCELGVDKAAYQVRFDCLNRLLDEGSGEAEARQTCQSEFYEELARL